MFNFWKVWYKISVYLIVKLLSFSFFYSYYRFIVREFTYNEVELAAGKNEISKLVTDKKKQFVSNILN